MADLLAELTSYLATAAGLVVGTSLFRAGLPAQSSVTISAIIPTGGAARGNLPVRQATYQILTRAETERIGDCMTQADALYAACLDSLKLPKCGVPLATLLVSKLEPLQPPADLGLDTAGRRRTSFNISVSATE